MSGSRLSEMMRVPNPGMEHLLWNETLLSGRLILNAILRYTFAASILLGALFARHVVSIRDVPLGRLGIIAAVLAIYNTGALLSILRLRKKSSNGASSRHLALLQRLTVTADYLVLTWILCLIGGIRSPFCIFYLLHITLSSMMLKRVTAWINAGFALLLISFLALCEHHPDRLIPIHMPEGAVLAGPSDPRFTVALLGIYGLLILLTTFLMTTLSRDLRTLEYRLKEANKGLEELSQLRRSFLHVVLHDVRAPIGAVKSLLYSLPMVEGDLSEKQKELMERAHRRLDDMLKFVREFQVFSSLEKAEVENRMERVDLPPLLETVADDFRDLAGERGHSIKVETPDTLPQILGVERLIREAVGNYLSNAVKYTENPCEILLRAETDGNGVRMSVKDCGRGIPEEDLERLFREFSRIHTKDSRGRLVPGTGLGLSITQRIAELHGGRVDVESAPDRGSTFSLWIPT